MSDYEHAGWTGVPYESDFSAKWGTITTNEMYVAENGISRNQAAVCAREGGYRYMIHEQASPVGNRLYKVEKHAVKCVYAVLSYMQKNAEKGFERYQNDVTARHAQVFRAARSRAKTGGIPFDLVEEDILSRMSGRCEQTGIAFNLTDVNSGLGPSLDQIEPQGGYTKVNVQVVCAMYNFMKRNYPPHEVEAFVAGIRGQG